MYMPTESLRPMPQPAINPVVLTLDTAPSAAPAAPSRPAHDPVAVAQAAELQRIACRSFHVSGAQVDVQRVLFGLVPWLRAERCDVENVSKGGVSFESRLAMVPGESVELSLRVPGESGALSLKGEVTWCKRARYGGYRVGARFAPYGEAHGRNSRQALEALRALEAKHA
jgi:hypothetical protein